MKIVALMIAALAMIGFAAAWDTTEQMQYQYQKTVDTQAGENLQWLDGASSYAGFNSQTGYGNSNAWTDNFVGGISASAQPVDGLSTNTDDYVAQSGSAIVQTASPDLENPSGIQYAGQASTSDDVHLSGNYADASATFGQCAGLNMDSWNGCGNNNDFGVSGSSCPWDNGNTGSSIQAGYNTNFVEADLGQSTSVGYEQINAPGALPTMSGSSSAWAGFSGAYTTDGSSFANIQTNKASSANFNMYKNNWGCPE